MKKTLIILSLIAFLLLAILFIRFSGIWPRGEIRSTSSVREIPSNTNVSQEDLPTNTNQERTPPSATPQPSPLLSPEAIRLDTLNGKSCYFVKLADIEPEDDPELKTYRFIVDFGPFGDTCVQVFPPGSIDGKNTFAKEGNAAGRRIGDTTFREFIYQYEE